MIVNRKTWADQVEEEDKDYADMLHAATEEEAVQFSATTPSKEEATKVITAQAPTSKYGFPTKRGLSPNTAVFVPSGQQQLGNNTSTSNAIEISSTHQTAENGVNNSISSTYNLTPTNILHVLVSHDMESLRNLGNLRNDQQILVSGFNTTETFRANNA